MHVTLDTINGVVMLEVTRIWGTLLQLVLAKRDLINLKFLVHEEGIHLVNLILNVGTKL